MRLALEALPETSSDYPQRPFVKEAQNQLYAAVEQHWRGIWEHDGHVNHVQFSPDGKRLLTATGYSDPQNPAFGNDAYIWEFPSGKLRHVLRGHTQSVTKAYFSPNAQKVLTVSFDDTARLWDVATGKQLAVIGGKHFSLVFSAPADFILAEFSPDGQRIALASPETNEVYLYDAETGQELFILVGHKQPATSVNFNSEGTRIFTTSKDNTARVWDAKTGRQLIILNKDEKVVISDSDDSTLYESPLSLLDDLQNSQDSEESVNRMLAGIFYGQFSPYGKKVITTNKNGQAVLWDAEKGKKLNTLFEPENNFWQTASGYEYILWRVAFSPNGKRIAIGTLNTKVRLWDAETGQELAVLKGHKNTIWSIGFSPDGEKIVTTSEDKTARLWSG
jgi:WD40 repeat protein